MNPAHLRAFVTAKNLGSFSKAAEVLYITRQALILQVQALEKNMGVKLFNRSSTGVSLTPAGAIFYDGANHILSYTEALQKRCREAEVSELRVGTSHEITPTFLYQISYEFMSTYPQIPFNIVYTDSISRFAELMDHKFDLCESFHIDTIAQYGLEFFPVLDTQIYVIVSKNHPFAKKESVSQSDMKDQTILLSTAQIDSFGNPQLPTQTDGTNIKRYHDLTSKKLETALGNAIYFDYALDTIDTDVFVRVPYCQKSQHIFGFVHKANPSSVIKNFLEVAKGYRCST